MKWMAVRDQNFVREKFIYKLKGNELLVLKEITEIGRKTQLKLKIY